MSEVSVIIPVPPEGGGGVVVCDLAALVRAAVRDRGLVDLDDLAFDSTTSDTEVIELVPAVRALNASGDVDAYWQARGRRPLE